MNKIASISTAASQKPTGNKLPLLLATLYCKSGSRPVAIKNFTSQGALVEAVGMPAVGEAITLKRGTLHVRGKMAWNDGDNAGIEFNSPVRVSEWIVTSAHRSQQLVDAMIDAFKRGSTEIMAEADHLLAAETIEDHLKILREDLSSLGNSLISDVILVATHPEIQELDISIQRIDRLIELIEATRGRWAECLTD